MTSPESLSVDDVTSTILADTQKYAVPIVFTPVQEYTTFDAEFAATDGDLVFHFYATKEVNELPNPKKYWLEVFPSVLEATAKEYFKVEYPRLKAAYTEEKASWWMRAYGFGGLLDPHAFAYQFLVKLDAGLDGLMTTAA